MKLILITLAIFGCGRDRVVINTPPQPTNPPPTAPGETPPGKPPGGLSPGDPPTQPEPPPEPSPEPEPDPIPEPEPEPPPPTQPEPEPSPEPEPPRSKLPSEMCDEDFYWVRHAHWPWCDRLPSDRVKYGEKRGWGYINDAKDWCRRFGIEVQQNLGGCSCKKR